MLKFTGTVIPSITVMLKSTRKEELISEIGRSLAEGAESFCLLYESLDKEAKTDESIREIMAAMENRPIYVTNYIRNSTDPHQTDGDRAARLLELFDMGASLIDIRTDMFCPSPDEVTEEPSAVEKQIKLIEKIHSRGGEVIMSSHIFRYTPPEEVLRIAKLQEARGADIAKIVTVADTEKELNDAFGTLSLLKSSLSIPFLYLINGKMCAKHRMLSGVLGSCIYLCRENSYTGDTQPTVEEVKEIIKRTSRGEI